MRRTIITQLFKLELLQQLHGYKKGWIWKKLQKEFSPFDEIELCAIGEFLDYPLNWAWQQLEAQQKKVQRQTLESLLQAALELFGLTVPLRLVELEQAYQTLAKSAYLHAGTTLEQFQAVLQAYQLLREVAV